MIERIDQRWLLSFLQIYECGSFKKAAQQLGLPSSNVSRHLALLEAQLAVRLLDRTTRRMQPTEAGVRLYEAAKPLTGALDRALEQVCSGAGSLAGQLRICMPDLPLLADALAGFCRQHPGISLSVETSLSGEADLLDGFDLVLAFGRGTLPDSDWVAKGILRQPSLVVASPAFIARHGTPASVQALADHPCITTLSALGSRPWRFEGEAGPQTLAVSSPYRVNSGNLALALALQGLGLAILPAFNCQAHLKAGRLVSLALDKPPADLVLYAFYSKAVQPPAKVQALLQALGQLAVEANSQP
ncbi:LysR family transcriptional regulator [Gallaecimonas xiamenensis]|uniref:LysR family transcriptional regulator n=1 Tax=Gallaecimonas xiamenensis 3-C-1 TaxID=745411 RepID=K2IKH8_9GAMM|nr:LysR family transcriptional regulator [Gallaecimonas xiamenensis]EKE70631.1 LysR family transcriptional regulator [Gallaecimonas xiamenensis 3-C-1]